ncbi:MAG TPA: metalloregulator ArsR/SmtB family transcription factor [Chloroflexota bacterium]|jgi:ArsR family transcriptional regulator|nr:metalloregulator ArsR/SmtB family transcription factor [Chloroflexota bacterium]
MPDAEAISPPAHGPANIGPRDLSANLRALADVTRLRILQALWQRQSATVTDLCEELRVSQPLMSWHLRILRRSGLITTHRDGRQVHCAANRMVLDEYGSLLGAYLESDPEPTAPAGVAIKAPPTRQPIDGPATDPASVPDHHNHGPPRAPNRAARGTIIP